MIYEALCLLHLTSATSAPILSPLTLCPCHVGFQFLYSVRILLIPSVCASPSLLVFMYAGGIYSLLLFSYSSLLLV